LFLVSFIIFVLEEVSFRIVDDFLQVEDLHASASEASRDTGEVDAG
jgi:hypothetical protein